MSVPPTEPVALSTLTTLRVGGFPERYIAATERETLIEAIREAWEADDELLVLGGGSNIVVADDGFPGTVLHVLTTGVARMEAPRGIVRLRIEAGEPWDSIVALTVRNGWSGIEALSGIPGSVGAAPVQNIGAYGQEIASVLQSVEFLDQDTGDLVELTRDQLELGYRTSALKQGRRGVVLSVVLDLMDRPDDAGVGSPLGAPLAYEQLANSLGVALGARVSMAELRRTVLRLRATKGMLLDPGDPDSVSAGSFFTNPIVRASLARTLPPETPRWPLEPERADTVLPLGPEGVDPYALPGFAPSGGQLVKLSAAWLIEHAGIVRGFALPGSGAAISSKHTLALVNRSRATAADIVQLADFIQYRVQADFGITLQPEPVLVGLGL